MEKRLEARGLAQYGRNIGSQGQVRHERRPGE